MIGLSNMPGLTLSLTSSVSSPSLPTPHAGTTTGSGTTSAAATPNNYHLNNINNNKQDNSGVPVIGSPAGSSLMSSRRLAGAFPNPHMLQFNLTPSSATTPQQGVPTTSSAANDASTPNSIANTPHLRPKKVEVGSGQLIISSVLAHRLRAGTAAAFDDEGKLLVNDLPASIRTGLESLIESDKDVVQSSGNGKVRNGNDDREVRFYEPPLSSRQSINGGNGQDDEEEPLSRTIDADDAELRHTLEEQLTRSRGGSRSSNSGTTLSLPGIGPTITSSGVGLSSSGHSSGSNTNNKSTPQSPARGPPSIAEVIAARNNGSNNQNGSQQPQQSGHSPVPRGRLTSLRPQSRRGSVTKLKGVRVILPDAQGSLLLPAGHLNTVRQLRDEIWQTCLQRRLIADEDGTRSWLAVQGTETKLHDDLRLELLAQARQQSIVTVCVLSREEEYSGSDHIRHYRDIILEQLLNVIRTGRSCTVVIEGDSGLGKTRLLSSTINESPIAIYCGAGNPFEMSKPLSVWRDIFIQLIDTELDKQRGADIVISGAPSSPSSSSAASTTSPTLSDQELQGRRRQLVLSKLSLKPYYGHQSMDVLAPLLNDILPLAFEDTPASRTIEPGARIAHAHALLYVLMQIFVASCGPLMIVIDDAVFLDARSWQLLLKFSRSIEGLMLLIATRPINKSYMSAFSKSVPEEYNSLVTDPQCLTINIEPRPDDVIYQIACDCLGKVT
jgi:hypothetical protein